MDSTNQPPQNGVFVIKAAMTGVLVLVIGLTYVVFGERDLTEATPAALPALFVAAGVVSAGMGFWFGARSRAKPEHIVISAACFEQVTLLAFVLVCFMSLSAPLWVVPAAAVISAAGMWLVSPNSFELQP